MLLNLLGYLMKFVDISKTMHSNRPHQQQERRCTHTSPDVCQRNACWQHVAQAGYIGKMGRNSSNSSSTSSGCESNSSSKENYAYLNDANAQQNMEQMYYQQQVQQQQIQLLQQQLLQRRILQQQLHDQGLLMRGGNTMKIDSTHRSGPPMRSENKTLTCNQQYLLQQRLQREQRQQFGNADNNNRLWNNELDHRLNNNNNNNNNYNNNGNNNDVNTKNNNFNSNYNNNFNYNTLGGHNNCGTPFNRAFLKGSKSQRGMTEFSTSNVDSTHNKSHLSQPLQNSPRHTTNNSIQHYHNNHHLIHQQHYQPQQQQQHLYNNLTNNHHHHHHISNSPHTTNKNLSYISKPNIGNPLPLNSSANIKSTTSSAASTVTTPLNGSTPASAAQSPLHQYRNPLNSPNNSPFPYASYQQQKFNNAIIPQAHFFGRPQLQTQYTQHLNDLLLREQNLQQKQHQLLLNARNSDDKGTASIGKDANSESCLDDLSEESLKQNVAIVLSNLNRSNNVLRSIILNEQVSGSIGSSSVFYDDSFLVDSVGSDYNLLLNNGNNNYKNGNANGNNYNSYSSANKMATAATPESDYNSNATTPASRSNMLPAFDCNMPMQQQQQQHGNVVGGVGGGLVNNIGGGGGVGVGGFYSFGNNVASNNLNCSIASSHDFTHDNSDYQWFLDCGYRDGYGGMQRSVLSSLSASYGVGDPIFYEDMAKNLDANLAEVDMESFQAQDIHSLISRLPSYCKSLGGGGGLSGNGTFCTGNPLQQSLQMRPQNLQLQNGGHHNTLMSQTSTTSTNELIDNSICKSELLFSPVKESHISVDSLDMDGYPDEGDIILTCKANKDNYTIAFEGSVLYSDESFYEPNEIAMRNRQNFINLHSNLEDIVRRKALDVSMSRSEQVCASRGKLQKSSTTQLQRYPSGNNNTTDLTAPFCHAPHCLVRKSNSLPNLHDSLMQLVSDGGAACAHKGIGMELVTRTQDPAAEDDNGQHEHQQQQLNVSQALNTSTVESSRTRNLLPMCQMPISTSSLSVSISEQDQQRQAQCSMHSTHQRHHRHHHHHHHHQQQPRCCCVSPHSGSGSGSGGHSSSASGSSGSCNSHNSLCASNQHGQCHHQQQQQQHHQQQLQQQQQKHSHISGSASSGNSNPPAFNLVKLFIKQKSSNCSFEEPAASVHTCMDVSSGCWPSSDAAGSSSNSSSSLEQRLRRKSMHDSGKGSALSRHDEEQFHCNGAQCTVPTDPVMGPCAGCTSGGIQQRAITPKRHFRTRSDAVFYDEEQSSSSTGSLTATNSPAHRRRSMPPRHPQLCQLAVQTNAGSVASGHSVASSDASRSNSEQVTQIYHSAESAATDAAMKSIGRTSEMTRTTSTSSEMITRSMQTSCGSLSTRSSLSERFRCVPPSFLTKLNTLGEERQAPIYVIYPSYALPDLGFVKTHTPTDVIFSPFNYKMSVGATTTTTTTTSSIESLKKRLSVNLNDDEFLRSMDYKHITDWHSLATLLPAEYRRRLNHIPEVNRIMRELEGELSQRPLFCMTPPVRRSRQPNICDCASNLQSMNTPVSETAGGGSSSSGSSQQPSSGYRGSSTLLTDSELDAGAAVDPLKQLYIQQYEQQKQRQECGSGGDVSSPAGQTMPRGILRKSSSVTTPGRNKRNSMIEEQHTKLSKQEKRRSLQEPTYHNGIGSSEELGDVYEEGDETDRYELLQPRKERLSRKELDARIRAENFLSSLPRSELKHYAEIASILESDSVGQLVAYDAVALKKEVSRALSQQKKVSFNDLAEQDENTEMHLPMPALRQQNFLHPETRQQRFSTPPNSPNHSAAGITTGGGGLRTPNGAMVAAARRNTQVGVKKPLTTAAGTTLDEKERRKLETNRFKRLQIQWELMSKDSSMLKDLACEQETKSGGSTPTSALAAAASAAADAAAANKSRIPRPVSYPAGRSKSHSAIPTIESTDNTDMNRTFVKWTSTTNIFTNLPSPRSYNTARTQIGPLKSKSNPAISTLNRTTIVSHIPITIQRPSAKIITKPNAYVSSRIANRINAAEDAAKGKGIRSPSRLVAPKRYSMTAGVGTTGTKITSPLSTPTTQTTTNVTTGRRARTPTSNRVAVTAPNTPKHRVQSPRATPRVR